MLQPENCILTRAKIFHLSQSCMGMSLREKTWQHFHVWGNDRFQLQKKSLKHEQQQCMIMGLSKFRGPFVWLIIISLTKQDNTLPVLFHPQWCAKMFGQIFDSVIIMYWKRIVATKVKKKCINCAFTRTDSFTGLHLKWAIGSSIHKMQ